MGYSYAVTLIKEFFATVIHADGGFVDPRDSETRVFVCGSLMSPDFVSELLGHPVAMSPALVKGFSRGWGESDGAKFHFLRKDPDGIVPGMALLGLSDSDIAQLEEFEQVPAVRMKVSISITIGDALLPGHTYLKKE